MYGWGYDLLKVEIAQKSLGNNKNICCVCTLEIKYIRSIFSMILFPFLSHYNHNLKKANINK